MLEPKSDHAGLRGSREVARQIAARLAEMEREHFACGPSSDPEREAQR